MSWTGIFLQATLMLCGMTDISDSNVCVDYYSPVEGTDIRSVEGYEANWSTQDQLCKDTHFSYNLIQRSAIWKEPRLLWNESLCAQDSGTLLLPLRMKKSINRKVYWINDYGVDDEELTKEELEFIDPDALNGLNTFGGFVHDPTFGMTFVSREHKFTCSLCEILRRKSLKTPVGLPPPPPGTVVEYWVHIRAISASPVDAVRRDLAAALNIPVVTVEHMYTQQSQATFETTNSMTSLQTTTATVAMSTTTTGTTTGTTTASTKSPATTTAATTTAATTTAASVATTIAGSAATTTEATTTTPTAVHSTFSPSRPLEETTPQFTVETTATSETGPPLEHAFRTTQHADDDEDTSQTEPPLEHAFKTTQHADDEVYEENGDEKEKIKPMQQNEKIIVRNRNKRLTSSANLSSLLQSMSIEDTGKNANSSLTPHAAVSSSEEEATGTTDTTTTTVPTTTTSGSTPDTSTQTTPTTIPTDGSSTTPAPDSEVQVYSIKLTNADPLLPRASNVLTPSYFNITSIDCNNFCVGETADDAFGNRHYWPDTKPGVVVVKRNKKEQNTTLTARECTYTAAAELLARWTEPTVWSETWKECSSPIDPNENDIERLEDAGNYLANLTEVPVLSRQLNDIAEVVNEVLKLDEHVLTSNDESTTKIVQDLETIFSNMMIETGDVVNATQSNLAFVVSDVQSSMDTVVGVSISTDDGDNLELELVRSSTLLSVTNQTQVRTVLPYELVKRHTRLAFMIFPDGKLFPSGQGSKYKTNSHVINIIMVNDNLSTHALEGEYIEISFNPLLDVPTKKMCGYWNFTENNWETSGCSLMNSSDSHLDVCRCTHLTNFAEIITGGSKVTGANKQALNIISLVGCSISMSALLAIALTAILFEHWRRELSNKILLNMSAAIALNLAAFFLVAAVRPPPDSVGCVIIGVILHYSVLTCFFWMLVMSTLQLLRLVTMMGARSIPNLLLKTTLFAWGIPLLPIIVLLSINPHIYTTSTGTDLQGEFCYPAGAALYATLIAPIVVVMTINLGIFVVIMFRIHSWCGWGKLETLERHGLTDRNIALRRFNTSVLLFFLFGLSWTFGIFASGNIVLDYLFCITATMQGFVLFVFLVLLERKTSGYWKTAIAEISNKNRSSELSHSGSKISETSFRSLPFSK